MLAALLDRFRPNPLRARVEASIRRGTGLSRREWLLGPDPLTASSMQQLGEEILEWCRERMSASRRPYGIDQMALAVACARPGGEPLSSVTFGVFRPVEFYTADGIAARVQDYLHGLPLADLNQREGPIRFAAALFSWGDVARDTVFADAPAEG
ncbi:MAG: hypothetical protein M0R73_11725 [Dehalococcoidia bacterium]|nr:hypothetical protein [Dehalococcoidia bacterium]